MSQIEQILKEREKNCGDFYSFSNLSQTLYGILMKHRNDLAAQQGETANVPPYMAEGLRMICHKLARLANGNMYHHDSWVDIGGYSKLVADIVKQAQEVSTQALRTQTESPEVTTHTKDETNG